VRCLPECLLPCAQGVQTCVGGYDLVTGVRLGRVDLRTPAVALMFSRDGSLLVVATQVCICRSEIRANLVNRAPSCLFVELP
jgi:hypothetical protein